MSVDNKVPEIRFKGFSEAWVDSDLKSFSDSFSYGLNASAVKFDGVNKYLRITDIDEKSRNFDYCQLTSPDADLSKSDNYLLKKGDILFARTGASVGKTYIYNEQDGKVYFAGFLIRASINHEASAQFIFQNTQTHEYARFVATTSQRSGQPGINAKEYGEYRLFSPTEPEQTQIGNYFQKLDTLINQHQQKHDKLSSIKKAMLEKMFPKQGETIPEIRFKGFSGEWEEKSVGQFGEIITGSTPSTQNLINYSNDGIPWVTPTDISRNVTFNTAKRLSQTGCKVARIVPKDTILVTCIASIGKNTILGTQGGFNQQINGIIPNQKDNHPYFIFSASILWSEKLKRSAASGTMQIVNKTEFSELKTRAPKKEEQTAIGNYFQKLDSLIDQHQQQITKLNNIKQACLSKMFV
uniref:Restriction modification system DNA specificity domain n=1 Tax=Serratia proteamaculans (strain 568) TaxID=399741 RepID=A8GJ88_SERP5